MILKEAGIDPDKDFSKQQLTQSEGVMALKDGNIDAVFWNFAAPGSAVLELAAQRDIVLVPIPADVVKKVVAKYPYLLSYTIKAGTYPKVDKDVLTIADANYLVVKKGMDEKLSYSLIKTILENQKKFMDVTPQAAHFNPQEASLGKVAPFTPGAVKYFKEKGVQM
jgi:TRAP transporter TAXI family solute receptor